MTGKHVLVLGAARSGICSAELLLRNGAKVIVFDQNEKLDWDAFFKHFEGADKPELIIGEFPDIVYSISATTRAPREGEVNGVHYFFKTKEEFEQMIKDDALVEYNLVHGNYYGTPKSFVEDMLKQGKRVLFDLDVFGKVNFDKVYPDATGILILPPSEEELERRLRGRGTDSEEVIQTRLHNAKKEMEFAKTKGKYEYTIVNDDLERAADELRAILKE